MSSRFIPALALATCLGAATAAPPDPADARLPVAAPRPKPPAAASASASASASTSTSTSTSTSGAAVIDPGVGDWRAANRRVLEAGGWRALLRESQAASAPSGAHHHH